MKSLLALITAAMLVTPVMTAAAGACSDEGAVMYTSHGLPDHQLTGNRVVAPCEVFSGDFEDLELDERPVWVLPHPTQPGDRWILTAADGRAFEMRDGGLSKVRSRLDGAGAPQAAKVDGRLLVRPRSRPPGTDDPIPHGRLVSSGFIGAALAGPTDRYPHGVLGDGLEASSLQIWSDIGGAKAPLELPEHEVIEGISAIVAQLGDDVLGFLVTVSDEEVGARLRAYGEDGEIIAESEPVGRGFRWLHQIGVGPTGPDGEIEIIAVRTPHIGGIVEAYRLDGDRFERVAAIEGYSSHVIGSPNLDMALLADTDADGQLEVIVPTQAMTELAILERVADGFEEVMRLPLDGGLASNVAAAVGKDGHLSLAVATDDGRLRIFR